MKMEASGLDGYFIYYREATSAGDYSKITVLGQETEAQYIDHLKPGTAYDIKIQSFNRAGASNFSSIIAAKTTGNFCQRSWTLFTKHSLLDLKPFNYIHVGTASTERPDYENGRHREEEIIIPDEPPPSNEHLYLLMGCLFVGFWVFICLGCTVCYRCKQKRGIN